ncbi:MAG: hypothetical protein ACQSGP_11130 [Frankia sp.]
MAKRSYRRVLFAGVLGLGSAVLVGPLAAGPTAAAGPADRPPVAPVLLTAPDAVTQAVDISPSGVVVGTAAPQPASTGGMTAPPAATGWRWLPVRGAYVGQELSVPVGTTSVSIAGVTDLGEAGGTVQSSAISRQPVRWSVSGRQTTPLGSAAGGPTTPNAISTTSAVGPAQWAVSTTDTISGAATLVARNGIRTELSGTPDLTEARIVTAYSIGGPNTALLGTTSGVGQGSTGNSVIWRNGATLTLPVFSSFPLGNDCTSAIQPDGSVAYSGPEGFNSDGVVTAIALHRGGIPGTEMALPTGGRAASVGCPSLDTLSADGSVVGQLAATATQPAEAALWRNGILVPLGVRAGESATALAVATRGRVVLVATTTAGVSRPYLWSNGVRTPLALPTGWTLRSVVELTDAGAVLANLRNAAGDVRPVVWNTGR